MSYMLDDIKYLCREIGARPAGTEEERNAAMYVAESISKRSGLNFNIEDFEGARGRDRVFEICAIINAVLIIVCTLLPIITIPAFVITLLLAIVIVLEALGKPILSGFMRYGISQNVVAKYEPSFSPEKQSAQRKRKIVLVSHYDSAHSVDTSSTSKVFAGYILKLVSIFASCLIPIVLLVKIIAFSDVVGSATLILLILAVVLGILAISFPIFNFVISRFDYNEGANCNASGTAALIEIARLLGTGAFGGAEEGSAVSEPRVHGGEAAAASGLIPEGAEVNYSAKTNAPVAPDRGYLGDTGKIDDALEQREAALANAKAAVAAFVAPRQKPKEVDVSNNPTIGGQKVVGGDEAQKASGDAHPATKGSDAAQSNITIDDAAAARVESQNVSDATPVSNMPQYETNSTSGSVPSWFKSAQSKAAEKNAGAEPKASAAPVRSRFAHTMDAMAQKREAAQRAKQEEEEAKRAKLRAQIEAANIAANKKAEEEIGETSPFFRSEGDQTGTSAPTVAPQQAAPQAPAMEQTPASAQAPVAPPQPVAPQVPTGAPQTAEAATPEATQPAQATSTEATQPAPAGGANEPKLSLDERFKRRQMNTEASDNKPEASKPQAMPAPVDAPSAQATPAPEATSAAPSAPQQPAPQKLVSVIPDLNEPKPEPKPVPVAQKAVANINEDARQQADLGATVGIPMQGSTDSTNRMSAVVTGTEAPSAEPVQDTPVNQAPAQEQPAQVAPQTPHKPNLRPQNSGSIDLEHNKQYAPLDDANFVKTPDAPDMSQVEGNESAAGIPSEQNADSGVVPTQSSFAPAPDSGSSFAPTPETSASFAPANNQQVNAVSQPDSGFAPVQPTAQPANNEADIFNQKHEKGKFGTGSFKAVSQDDGIAGATGTFAPVTDQLISESNVGEGNMVIDDADDSAFSEQGFTDAGAFAGPGYVDMPDKKHKGFFSRLGKGGGKHGGKHSGGNGANGDNIIDNNAWEGGAFSNIASKLPKIKKDKAPDQDIYEDIANGDMQEGFEQQPQDADASGQFMNNDMQFGADDNQQYYGGDGAPGPITSEENRIESMLDPIPNFDEQIQEFHEGSINLEVWMVALGSEVDENSGIRNFLMEHSQELRGAIIVDIEALGAGELSVCESEGLIRKTHTTSRLMRYVRRAANKMGVSVPSVGIPWLSSAAGYANRYGFNAIKFCGMQGGKPAYYLQDNDVVEVIDENILNQNIKFLIKFIQSV